MIKKLVKFLKPYFKTIEYVGYEGGRDSGGGLRSGYGIMRYRYQDRGFLDSSWKNDKKNI